MWNHDERRLYINGEPVNIQGFNRHQEYPWLGDAIPYFIHRMDLLDMKRNLNCTALRPGQYCSGPEVFALADSLGLITFAELPNVKNRPFSPEVQWMQTVEMVRRLRNSPSVLLFDMGDETDRRRRFPLGLYGVPRAFHHLPPLRRFGRAVHRHHAQRAAYVEDAPLRRARLVRRRRETPAARQPAVGLE